MKNDPKWKDDPKTPEAAIEAVKGKTCPICGSNLLVILMRPPIPVRKIHCSHCATEIPIAVLLNRDAWAQEWKEVSAND